MTETNPTNLCEAAASSPSNQTRIKLEEAIDHLAGCVRSHAMPSQPFGPKPCSLEDIEKSKGKIRLLVDGLLDELQAVEKELRERSGDLERIRSLVPSANWLAPTFDVIRTELANLQERLRNIDSALAEAGRPQRVQGDEVERIRGLQRENQELIWNLAGISTIACAESLDHYAPGMDWERPALTDTVRLVRKFMELRATARTANPNLTAEAKIAIAAMRDVSPELVKAGIQMGPRLSHGEAVAQLRGERDRWRENFEAADAKHGGELAWIEACKKRLREVGEAPRQPGMAGVHNDLADVLDELRTLRKESKRDRVAKQQAMLDEIARLFPGKGPLLDRVRAKIGADVSNGKTAPSAWRERFMRLRDGIKAQIAWCTLPGGAPLAGMHKEHAVLSIALSNADALLVEAAREGGASWLSAQGLLERRFPDAKPKQEDAVDGRRKLFEASVDAFADKIDRELMQHVPQFEGDPKDCALSHGNKLPEKPPAGAPSIVPKLDLELIGAHLRHAIDLLGKQK
jgi:hypothetical protein